MPVAAAAHRQTATGPVKGTTHPNRTPNAAIAAAMRELVFRITDGAAKVTESWFSLPLPDATTSQQDALRVSNLGALLRQLLPALAGVRFSLTSLSGSLLLPNTPLSLLPAVVVRVSPADFDKVLSGYEQDITDFAPTPPPAQLPAAPPAQLQTPPSAQLLVAPSAQLQTPPSAQPLAPPPPSGVPAPAAATGSRGSLQLDGQYGQLTPQATLEEGSQQLHVDGTTCHSSSSQLPLSSSAHRSPGPRPHTCAPKGSDPHFPARRPLPPQAQPSPSPYDDRARVDGQPQAYDNVRRAAQATSMQQAAERGASGAEGGRLPSPASSSPFFEHRGVLSKEGQESVGSRLAARTAFIRTTADDAGREGQRQQVRLSPPLRSAYRPSVERQGAAMGVAEQAVGRGDGGSGLRSGPHEEVQRGEQAGRSAGQGSQGRGGQAQGGQGQGSQGQGGQGRGQDDARGPAGGNNRRDANSPTSTHRARKIVWQPPPTLYPDSIPNPGDNTQPGHDASFASALARQRAVWGGGAMPGTPSPPQPQYTPSRSPVDGAGSGAYLSAVPHFNAAAPHSGRAAGWQQGRADSQRCWSGSHADQQLPQQEQEQQQQQERQRSSLLQQHAVTTPADTRSPHQLAAGTHMRHAPEVDAPCAPMRTSISAAAAAAAFLSGYDDDTAQCRHASGGLSHLPHPHALARVTGARRTLDLAMDEGEARGRAYARSPAAPRTLSRTRRRSRSRSADRVTAAARRSRSADRAAAAAARRSRSRSPRPQRHLLPSTSARDRPARSPRRSGRSCSADRGTAARRSRSPHRSARSGSADRGTAARRSRSRTPRPSDRRPDPRRPPLNPNPHPHPGRRSRSPPASGRQSPSAAHRSGAHRRSRTPSPATRHRRRSPSRRSPVRQCTSHPSPSARRSPNRPPTSTNHPTNPANHLVNRMSTSTDHHRSGSRSPASAPRDADAPLALASPRQIGAPLPPDICPQLPQPCGSPCPPAPRQSPARSLQQQEGEAAAATTAHRSSSFSGRQRQASGGSGIERPQVNGSHPPSPSVSHTHTQQQEQRQASGGVQQNQATRSRPPSPSVSHTQHTQQQQQQQQHVHNDVQRHPANASHPPSPSVSHPRTQGHSTAQQLPPNSSHPPSPSISHKQLQEHSNAQQPPPNSSRPPSPSISHPWAEAPSVPAQSCAVVVQSQVAVDKEHHEPGGGVSLRSALNLGGVDEPGAGAGAAVGIPGCGEVGNGLEDGTEAQAGGEAKAGRAAHAGSELQPGMAAGNRAGEEMGLGKSEGGEAGEGVRREGAVGREAGDQAGGLQGSQEVEGQNTGLLRYERGAEEGQKGEQSMGEDQVAGRLSGREGREEEERAAGWGPEGQRRGDKRRHEEQRSGEEGRHAAVRRGPKAGHKEEGLDGEGRNKEVGRGAKATQEGMGGEGRYKEVGRGAKASHKEESWGPDGKQEEDSGAKVRRCEEDWDAEGRHRQEGGGEEQQRGQEGRRKEEVSVAKIRRKDEGRDAEHAEVGRSDSALATDLRAWLQRQRHCKAAAARSRSGSRSGRGVEAGKAAGGEGDGGAGDEALTSGLVQDKAAVQVVQGTGGSLLRRLSSRHHHPHALSPRGVGPGPRPRRPCSAEAGVLWVSGQAGEGQATGGESVVGAEGELGSEQAPGQELMLGGGEEQQGLVQGYQLSPWQYLSKGYKGKYTAATTAAQAQLTALGLTDEEGYAWQYDQGWGFEGRGDECEMVVMPRESAWGVEPSVETGIEAGLGAGVESVEAGYELGRGVKRLRRSEAAAVLAAGTEYAGTGGLWEEDGVGEGYGGVEEAHTLDAKLSVWQRIQTSCRQYDGTGEEAPLAVRRPEVDTGAVLRRVEAGEAVGVGKRGREERGEEEEEEDLAVEREGRRGPREANPLVRHIGPSDSLELRSPEGKLREPMRVDEMYHFITSHAGATHGYAVRVWPFVPTPRPGASAVAAAAATTATTNQRTAAGAGGVSCWYSLASLEHEVRLWYNLGRNQCFRAMLFPKKPQEASH